MNNGLPNVSLRGKELSFTFPDIARTIRSLANQHIESVIEEAPPASRDELLRDFWEKWRMGEFNPALDEHLHQCVKRMPAEEREYSVRHLMKPGQTLNSRDGTMPIFRIMETLSRAALQKDPALEDGSVGLTVRFMRTFRVPDDGRKYPLPAAQGPLALTSVDDHPDTVPQPWLKRGGIALPMYQSEALWIKFTSKYPFAVMIGTGKIDAATGEPWSGDLRRTPQNYIVAPEQPWLDGYNVGKGEVRQFVAMPMGDGYTVEEQITGRAEIGGIQIQVHPMRGEAYFQAKVAPYLPTLDELVNGTCRSHLSEESIDPVLQKNERNRALPNPSDILTHGTSEDDLPLPGYPLPDDIGERNIPMHLPGFGDMGDLPPDTLTHGISEDDLPNPADPLADGIEDLENPSDMPCLVDMRGLPNPPDMGLSAGGKIRQEIYAEPYDFTVWDQSRRSRCFIHLCNSLVWRQVTGENPQHPPLTAKEYERAGLPWFDYYRDDLNALDGAEPLRNVKSIAEIGREKQTQPLPENSPVEINTIVQYGNTRRPGETREFLDAP